VESSLYRSKKNNEDSIPIANGTVQNAFHLDEERFWSEWKPFHNERNGKESIPLHAERVLVSYERILQLIERVIRGLDRFPCFDECVLYRFITWAFFTGKRLGLQQHNGWGVMNGRLLFSVFEPLKNRFKIRFIAHSIENSLFYKTVDFVFQISFSCRQKI
jgi:hypothetical protein